MRLYALLVVSTLVACSNSEFGAVGEAAANAGGKKVVAPSKDDGGTPPEPEPETDGNDGADAVDGQGDTDGGAPGTDDAGIPDSDGGTDGDEAAVKIKDLTDNTLILEDSDVCVKTISDNVAKRYSVRDKFVAETKAADAGLVPTLNSVATFAMGKLTFKTTAPRTFYSSNANAVYRNEVPGISLLVSGTEDFDVESGTALHAFGFTFLEPTGTAAAAKVYNSKFMLRFFKGAAEVGKVVEFNEKDDTLSFVGVWSKAAFDRVEIRDTTATIDNEIFGQFVVSESNANPCQ